MRSDITQNLMNNLYSLINKRITRINNMKQKIWLNTIFQSWRERLYQFWRQISDKPNRIIEQNLLTKSGFWICDQITLSHIGPQRRKKLILSQNSLISQSIEQWGLPSISISNDPNRWHSFLFTSITMEFSHLFIFNKLLLYFQNLLLQMSLHSFSIGFSDSSCRSTSTSRRTSLPT